MTRFAFVLALFVACAFCFSEAPAASTLRVASTETVESSTASEDFSEDLADLAEQLRTLANKLEALANGDDKAVELINTGILDDLTGGILRTIKEGLNTISGIIDGTKATLGTLGGNVKAIILQALLDIDEVLSKIQRALDRGGVLGSIVKAAFNALRSAVSTALTTLAQVETIKTDAALDILSTVEVAVDALRDVVNGIDGIL